MIGERRGERRGGRFAAAWLVLLLWLAGTAGTAAAEEGLSVYCYSGDRSLGTVLVFDVGSAAGACNELYYDCRGRCVACFEDSDYLDYVCVDVHGTTFLR